MRDPEDEIRFSKKKIQIIQIERAGRDYIMRVAAVGEPLQEVGRYALTSLADDVLVGLFISAHNENVIEEAKAWEKKNGPITHSLLIDNLVQGKLDKVLAAAAQGTQVTPQLAASAFLHVGGRG